MLQKSFWPQIEIGDVAKFSSGKSRPSIIFKEISMEYSIPVYGGNGILGYSNQHLFNEPKLIIGRVGEYCGCVHITQPRSWISDNALYMKESFAEADLTFLQFCFRYLNLNKFSNKMGQPLITQSIISKVKFACPPLPEQRKIAAILSTVQKAIENQQALIDRTMELKKAMMHKLFAEGTKGEKQKMTEIGLVPVSWEVKPLSEYIQQTQYGISNKCTENGKYPVLRMTNQQHGLISPNKLVFTDMPKDGFIRFRVDKNDLLFNRTNSFELVGRTAIFTLDGDYTFASYLIRIKTKDSLLDPFFLNAYFNSDETQRRLKSIASRAVSQSNISATRLSGFLVPCPKIDEQKIIVDQISAIDNKIVFHKEKKEKLEELFRTLLHQLMTAQIRVDNIDLNFLKDAA